MTHLQQQTVYLILILKLLLFFMRLDRTASFKTD